MLSSKNMNINDWVSKCTRTAQDKGWGWTEEQKKDPTFLSAQLMLCVTELAEGCEDLRKGYIKTKYLSSDEIICNEQLYIEGIPQYKPIGFPSELADVLIRIFHIAGEAGVDLMEEIRDKDQYNNTRSFRHGNKKL